MEDILNLKWAYFVIGADHKDSVHSIKKRYRELVKTWHPDKHACDPEKRRQAEVKMKEINNAYQMVRHAPLRYHISTHPKVERKAERYTQEQQADHRSSPTGKRRRNRRTPREYARARHRTEMSFRFFWGALLGAAIAFYFNIKFPDNDYEQAIWIGCPLLFAWLSMRYRDRLWSEIWDFPFWWW